MVFKRGRWVVAGVVSWGVVRQLLIVYYELVNLKYFSKI